MTNPGFATLFGLLLASGAGGHSHAAQVRSGAVYVMTDRAENAILVFERAKDGTLIPAGEFATGGRGNSMPPPGEIAPEPSGSQGSLILPPNGQYLFAANSGSSEISVLAVEGSRLRLVDKADSGGSRPISLTISRDLLYVLNAGDVPNIAGFRVDPRGHLSPLPGSFLPLKSGPLADPAQIGFNHDGTLLVVTDRAASTIEVFTRQEGGLVSPSRLMPSEAATPFGFAFDKRGHLFVAEGTADAPGQAAASSYTLSGNGTWRVASRSVPNFQTADCRIAISSNRRFAFLSNTGSGTVSSYEIGSNGTLRLRNSIAADLGAGSSPADLTLANGSRYLYILGGGSRSIHAYHVEQDLSLTALGETGGVPAGARGIAGR